MVLCDFRSKNISFLFLKYLPKNMYVVNVIAWQLFLSWDKCDHLPGEKNRNTKANRATGFFKNVVFAVIKTKLPPVTFMRGIK